MSRRNYDHLHIITLEELYEKRKSKEIYKSDFLGSKKVGAQYLYTLQDTAEHFAEEVAGLRRTLITVYQKLSGKKTKEELENMDSPTLEDYIIDALYFGELGKIKNP